ncbi:MAG: hypothetical protein VSS52_012415 [Thiotrichaceae bacterium]|nr:hypothetical protein [Thiotrichaceae bacterium]
MDIAYFITPHGFGHAARATAVMLEFQEIFPNIHFHIYTTVPRQFFETSLIKQFSYHKVLTDIGIVQKTPFEENIQVTIQHLKSFISSLDSQAFSISKQLVKHQCCLVLCDISPLGIKAAKVANIPSVLIENFRWDWIYKSYGGQLADFSNYFKESFEEADVHIQATPFCQKIETANLVVNPIARVPNLSKEEVRAKLNIPNQAKVVLLALGNMVDMQYLPKKTNTNEILYFIVTGSFKEIKCEGNIIFIPQYNYLFYVDILNASDVVIAKAGYSTIAEVYFTGISFGYVTRQNFAEMKVLCEFAHQFIPSMEILESEFQSTLWLEKVLGLLHFKKIERKQENGAKQIAQYIIKHATFLLS